MTEYCKKGDKPVIKYQFNGGAERIFKSKYAPIDVISKETPIIASENYNTKGYGISYIGLNGNGTRSDWVVTDHIIFNLPQGVDTIWGTTPRIAIKRCDDKSFRKVQDCNSYVAYRYTNCLDTSLINMQDLRIDLTKKCPQETKKRCSIVVLYKGLTIWSDQGDCPISFSVQCGNCPDGQHECESNVYPFYCCSDCAGTAAKINNLVNKYGQKL